MYDKWASLRGTWFGEKKNRLHSVNMFFALFIFVFETVHHMLKSLKKKNVRGGTKILERKKIKEEKE